MTPVNQPNQLADELLTVMFDSDPVASSLYGFRERDDLLPDNSVHAEQVYRARAEEIRDRAESLRSVSDLEERLTVAVVREQAQAFIDQLDAALVEYVITDNLFAPAASLLLQLAQVPITDAGQARNYLARLAAIPDYLSALAQRHRDGVAARRLPLAHLTRAAVDHLDRYLSAPESDPLRVQPMPEGGEERERLLDEVVRPAFRDYRDVLANEIAPHGRLENEPGLCWLPGGEETYRKLARGYTTTDRSPQELHQAGLEIIERLREEFAEVGSRALGISDFAELLYRLRTDPAFRWDDADQLMESARTAIRRAEQAAPRWFGQLPAEQCAVQPVPAEQAPGTPLAFYLPPAADGSRPGTYFANTHRVTERDRYISEVTAFHEAVPGHHFQLSLAQGLTGLPTLRQLVPFTAYAEGWGLYCERLADEMGLYSDDVSRLGMLSMDAVRACRLVVDSGLHALGWSREKALAFMRSNTALADIDVRAEVDRYIALPGQALSYMVGRLEIQRLRADAELRLGERFDIRAFHDTVLGHGALPLSTLDDVVTEALR